MIDQFKKKNIDSTFLSDIFIDNIFIYNIH